MNGIGNASSLLKDRHTIKNTGRPRMTVGVLSKKAIKSQN